ncbi:hypothetical protein SCHPADRAFT_1001765, partial [Schizopora paradoxa]
MNQDDASFDVSSILTDSSLSSTATAPNLPGPGRNIGLLFDRLGNGLERFASKRAERFAGTSARPSQLVRVDSRESIDTNATAPNLPGAGRTVGNVLAALGKGLEQLMTRRALQVGLGPETVARDIRAVYNRLIAPMDAHSQLGPQNFLIWRPSENDAKALTKLLKKLLKYSNAELLSTQLKALDEITALSVENNFLREILASHQLKKYLSPRYSEPELHWASAKAFLTIQEKEVHSVWSDFYHFAEQHKRFLRDANLSFIMARHIQNRLNFFISPGESNPTLDLWLYHLEIAASHPEIVEWELVDNHFASNPPFLVWASKSIVPIAYHMPKFRSKYSVQTAREQLFSAEDKTYDFQFLYKFLEELCDSADLATQLEHIRSFPDTTRHFLRTIVFGNELFIAYIHIVFHGAKPLLEMPVSLGFPSVIATKGEFPECAVFLYYLEHGTSDEQDLAELLISAVSQINRYCKSSIIALVDGEPEVHKNASKLAWAHERISCPASEPDTKLRRFQFSENDYRNKGSMDRRDALHYPSNSTIWLEVFGDRSPFDIKGHYPVLAGYTSGENPKELFAAMVYSQRQLLSVYYAYVEDGATAAEYFEEDGNKRESNTFYVLVLRHDPLNVEIPYDAEPKNYASVRRTGPAYWTRESSVGGPKSWLELFGSPIKYLEDADESPEDGDDSGMDGEQIRDFPSEKSFIQQADELRKVLQSEPVTLVDERGAVSQIHSLELARV